MDSEMAFDLKNHVLLDDMVTLYLLGGHSLTGYMNEWDHDRGLINMRRNENDQTVQYWVPIESIVAYTSFQPELK